MKFDFLNMPETKLAAYLGTTLAKTTRPVSRTTKATTPNISKWSGGHTYQGSQTKTSL